MGLRWGLGRVLLRCRQLVSLLAAGRGWVLVLVRAPAGRWEVPNGWWDDAPTLERWSPRAPTASQARPCPTTGKEADQPDDLRWHRLGRAPPRRVRAWPRWSCPGHDPHPWRHRRLPVQDEPQQQDPGHPERAREEHLTEVAW